MVKHTSSASSIWETLVGELEVEAARKMMAHLLLLQGWPWTWAEGLPLRVAVAALFRTRDGRAVRLMLDPAFLSFDGLLQCRIEELECPALREGLEELNRERALPLTAAQFGRMEVLEFLNDHFGKPLP